MHASCPLVDTGAQPSLRGLVVPSCILTHHSEHGHDARCVGPPLLQIPPSGSAASEALSQSSGQGEREVLPASLTL